MSTRGEGRCACCRRLLVDRHGKVELIGEDIALRIYTYLISISLDTTTFSQGFGQCGSIASTGMASRA
jgi:hypothetical protein